MPVKLTDKEMTDLCETLSKRFKYMYRFPGYDEDDISQEIYSIIRQACSKYDTHKGNIENYMSIAVRNRLKTLKRDKFRRIDEPCLKCPLKAWDPAKKCCTKFEQRMDCDIYRPWELTYQSKENIKRPIGITEISDEAEKNTRIDNTPYHDLLRKEICELIDANLPHRLRRHYLMFMNGQKINAIMRRELFEEVKIILEEAGYDGTEF